MGTKTESRVSCPRREAEAGSSPAWRALVSPRRNGRATRRLAAAFLVLSALFGHPALGETGKDVFATNCIPCHGPDGRARTPAGRKLHAKDLTESKLTDDEIRKQVNEGHRDERGAVMPPFKGVLKPEQIDAVIAYVKSLRK
jgi:cytochrome c oxidase cbb3-type subunit 3